MVTESKIRWQMHTVDSTSPKLLGKKGKAVKLHERQSYLTDIQASKYLKKAIL